MTPPSTGTARSTSELYNEVLATVNKARNHGFAATAREIQHEVAIADVATNEFEVSSKAAEHAQVVFGPSA